MFLKNNMIIFDFISKIIIGISSIIVVIIANQISNGQLQLNKKQTAPTFFINETEEISGFDHVYKIENVGGKINYFNFDRFDEFYISVGNVESNIYIHYFNNNDIEKYNKQNIWYFAPQEEFISTENFREKLLSDLKEMYPDEYILITIPRSFYKLTYHDYQNAFHEDYYLDYGYKVIFNKQLTELTMYHSSSDYKISRSTYIPATFDNSEKLYNNILKTTVDYINQYI